MEMQHIRPYQVLAIPDSFEEEFKFYMPETSASGVTTVFESVLILKLMRCVNPHRIFEFGTYKGLTTRLLLENLPPSSDNGVRIYTLDLPSSEGISFQGNDERLAAESVGYQRKYEYSPRKHWVEQLLMNSMDLDASKFSGWFQFIFIDANHEVSYAKNDTENAFKMLGGPPGVAKCIVWHDYGHPLFPELTGYLDELAKDVPLFHIENTMLVFHLQGLGVAPRR